MRRVLSILVLCSVVLAACTPTATQSGPPIVLASFSVLADITQNILGDVATVESLVGPDSDTHAYEPRPIDSARMQTARAVVRIGLGFEPWLDEVYRAAGTTAPLIDAAAEIQTHTVGTNESDVDPHIWHDAQRTIHMVTTIAIAMHAVFPAAADQIDAYAAHYAARLQSLDSELQTMAASIPAAARVLVTNHDTFGYFAERYGFTVIGTVFGASTGGSDPSASAIATLVEAIRSSGVRAIFVENMSNPDLLARVAREAGVTVAPALYTDALGAAGSPGGTYMDMMRSNMSTIVAALRGPA